MDSDVKTANALNRRGVKFKLNTEATGKIIVLRERDLGGFNESMAIVFELLPDKIAVTERRGPGFTEGALFCAAPGLNQEGECLLEIDGQPLKLWQVSRKALENLFFGF